MISVATSGEVAVGRPSLLIVEDKPVNMLVLSLMLKDSGYTVLEARDGIEAIEVATSESPDLILMDLMMPGMDGLAAAREILSRSGEKRPKIVAVTGNTLESLRSECLREGFAGVLLKPINYRELMATIASLRPAGP